MEFNFSEDLQTENLHINGLKLIQNRKHFMFGIDAVLLSDFSKIKTGNLIFDFGSGNGIISILTAAKYDVRIKAIEIQKQVFELLEENIKLNGFENKIEAVNINVKEVRKNFDAQIADVVICNPPYMKNNGAVVNENDVLAIARHEVLAVLDDFTNNASYILKPNGKLYLIHKPDRIAEIIISCSKVNLELKQMRFVVSREGEEPAMVLMEFVKCAKPGVRILRPLTVYKDDGKYSDEVCEIYGKSEG